MMVQFCVVSNRIGGWHFVEVISMATEICDALNRPQRMRALQQGA